MTGRLPLIVILGPTAVGKTGLAIKIAQAIDGEIISADSRQVYRFMDIGTAKPTAAQRASAIHHLIDIVDPDARLSLAEYQGMAYQAITAIRERGHVPLLVGGTGQYITAIIEGWSIPEIAPNAALRDELEAFAAQYGPDALHSRLHDLDPAAAARIHPNNVRRVVRALEVCIEAGTPITELQRKKPPPYTVLEYGLTMAREELYERADSRVDTMMQNGFLEEVRGLLERGYDRKLPSMSGLGYRELVTHLVDNAALEEAVEATKLATHDFIRRQYTWFRGHDSGILWHNIGETSDATLIQACVDWVDRMSV